MRTRRHHNNKGLRRIKRDKLYLEVERIALRLGIGGIIPMKTEQCKECKFCDLKAARNNKPWCTYPGKLTLSSIGACEQRREK